jgi:hypothetical protein
MRLYQISSEEIEECIKTPDERGKEGRYHVAYKIFPGRFSSLPLKVVYALDKEPVVVTVYPVRGVRWRR